MAVALAACGGPQATEAVWTSRFDTHYPVDVVAVGDSVVVVGWREESCCVEFDGRPWVARVDADGAVTWSAQAWFGDWSDVAADDDENVYVIGAKGPRPTTPVGDPVEQVLASLGPNGAPRWEVALSSGAVDVWLGGDGDVHVGVWGGGREVYEANTGAWVRAEPSPIDPSASSSIAWFEDAGTVALIQDAELSGAATMQLFDGAGVLEHEIALPAREGRRWGPVFTGRRHVAVVDAQTAQPNPLEVNDAFRMFTRDGDEAWRSETVPFGLARDAEVGADGSLAAVGTFGDGGGYDTPVGDPDWATLVRFDDRGRLVWDERFRLGQPRPVHAHDQWSPPGSSARALASTRDGELVIVGSSGDDGGFVRRVR